METFAMALDLGAAAPYGSVADAGCLVRSCHCRFHQLECQNRAHQKLERCAVLLPYVAAVWGWKTTIYLIVSGSVRGEGGC